MGGEPRDRFELAVLEDRIESALFETRVGRFNGSLVGAKETILYLHGPDADIIYKAVLPILQRIRLV